MTAFKEEDAYPALPEDGYGWEKLFSDACAGIPRGLRAPNARRAIPQRLRSPRNLQWRARKSTGRDLSQGHRGQTEQQNTKSKSGATANRRAASCISTTASRGRDHTSDFVDPINIGKRTGTINRLVDIVEHIAGIKLKRRDNLCAPKGVTAQQRQHTHQKSLRLGAEQGYATEWKRPIAGFTSRCRRNGSDSPI